MTAIDRTQQAANVVPSEEELRRMVGPDRHRPGSSRGRLIAEQIPVWAIIGHIGALAGSLEPDAIDDEIIAEAAHDYDISVTAVRAALLYYREHQCAIDTLLEENAAVLG
jgi:uncharacterized protein (DUF433 family)